MKKKKLIIIIWILALVVIALAIIIPSLLMKSPKDAYRNIKIELLEGTAVVERDNEKLEAFKGMSLRSNDSLLTKESSHAVLKLDEDKYIYIGETSDIDIVSSEHDSSLTKIRINEGSIVTEVKNKLSTTEEFNIESPNSTMAIRGTTFKTTVTKSTVGYEIKYSLVEGKINLSVVERTDEIINVGNFDMNAGEEITILAKGSAVLTRDNLSNVLNKIESDDPSVNKKDYANVSDYVSQTDKVDLSGKDLTPKEIGEILTNVINNHDEGVNRTVSANATFDVYLDENLIFSDKYVYENSKEYKIVAKAIEYEGFKVAYWLLNDEELRGGNSVEVTIKTTTFIQPVYEVSEQEEPVKETFRISVISDRYDENILLNNNPFNASRNIDSNKDVTFTITLPSNYTFVGYFEEGNDIALSTNTTYTFTPEKDMTIVVKYNIN